MSETVGPGLLLAFDTSTRSSVVAVGDAIPAALSCRQVQHRHASHLLEQIDEALAAADATLGQVAAVAVGTGPGSFSGLRVGLATAKTIAYARSLPLVGVRSADALRHAAMAAGAAGDAAVVLPAGARDHYLALAGADPELVAPGGLAEAIGERAVIAVDVEPGLVGREATRLGVAAVEGLPAALLALARTRFLAGDWDDVAELTPAYVALPRGVRSAAEELGWSPDLR
jgi:tRNA threonylcarbamoyl adenosine modification protein YeaZ